MLDLVTRSQTARLAFIAAYDGPGDAVGVLRNHLARLDDPAANAADRAHREHLAEAAFARPATKAESKAADRALAVYSAADALRARELLGLVPAFAAVAPWLGSAHAPGA